MTTELTIGWTRNTPETRAEGYLSYSDGYRWGTPQHTATIEVDAGGIDPVDICEAAFRATNDPMAESLAGLAGEIYRAIEMDRAIDGTQFYGHSDHYSLSVGDTVTIGELMYECAAFSWKRVMPPAATWEPERTWEAACDDTVPGPRLPDEPSDHLACPECGAAAGVRCAKFCGGA